MFVKLTKSDGTPVWLNPEFIVRIESWKTGSAVAAAGDGDFEVRETPAAILALCQAAPVPASKPAEEPAKPKTRGRRKKTETPPAEEASMAEPPAETPSAEEPAASVEEPKPESEPASVPAEAPAPAVVLSADTLFPDAPDEISCAAAILKKNRCRSRKRILNTLKSRNPKMSMDDARSMLEQMEARGFVSIDAQGHAVFN